MLFLFFLIIIILSIVYYTKYINKENYQNINSDIGNTLSDYYYQIIISILNKTNFNYNYVERYNWEIINNKNEFINAFPPYIPFNENIYNEFISNKINIKDLDNVWATGMWLTLNKNMEIIHRIMKPIIHNIFNETFTKLKLNKTVLNPIIHFRCADTPFEKQNYYYFQRYSYFQKALENLETKIGIISDVTILSCSSHLSNEQNKNSCNKYSNAIKDALDNYNVHIECNSNVDDFVTMFYAPAVISTISSFSFMSGYFGNGIFIQPTQMEFDVELCENCDNTYKGYNIKHSQVNNYHDFDEIYKLLNK